MCWPRCGLLRVVRYRWDLILSAHLFLPHKSQIEAHHLCVCTTRLHGSLSLYLCMCTMYSSIVSCPDLYAFRTVILVILLVCGTVPHLFLFRILHLQVSASEHPVPLISARNSQRFSGARGSVNQVCSLYRSTCSTSSIYSARVRVRSSLPL